MTPADYRVAVKLWIAKLEREYKRQDEMVARLAFFFNISVVPRKHTDKLPKVEDFMPAKGKPAKKKRLTDAQLQRKTEQIFNK